MKARSNNGMELWVAALLLALPVLLFWRSGFFFVVDDWSTLIQMAQYPFAQYLTKPDAENWFPFFHLIYYPLIKIAGEHYDFLILVNCLCTGVNAVLVYLFLRRHWGRGPALSLSLVYAVSAAHHVTTWNTYYLCYILCLGFFLGALLFADSYSRSPSGSKLAGAALCALLSALSHNFLLTGLMAIPLYVILLGDKSGGKFWKPLIIIVVLVYFIFALGYLVFAGSAAAASHDATILSHLPGWSYWVHIINGAYLSPLFYLFWGHFHFPVWAIVCGSIFGSSMVAVILWGGESRDRRLLIWVLLANSLPFLLISLARHHRSINQAFVPRYIIFTLIGVLLLAGTAYRILARRISPGAWGKILPAGLLVVIVGGNLFSLPLWRQEYLESSNAAFLVYRHLGSGEKAAGDIPPEVFDKFCPGAHRSFTREQVVAIKQFLTGKR